MRVGPDPVIETSVATNAPFGAVLVHSNRSPHDAATAAIATRVPLTATDGVPAIGGAPTVVAVRLVGVQEVVDFAPSTPAYSRRLPFDDVANRVGAPESTAVATPEVAGAVWVALETSSTVQTRPPTSVGEKTTTSPRAGASSVAATRSWWVVGS